MSSAAIDTYQSVAASLTIYLLTVYAIAQAVKDNSIVDIAWGPGLALITVAAYNSNASVFMELEYLGLPLRAQGLGRPHILAVLVCVWAARLAVHLAIRRAKHEGEDWRYQLMRQSWEPNVALRALIQVFVLQGVLMLVVAAPVVVTLSDVHPPLGFLDYVGAAIAIAGLAFEARADWELARFKRNPDNAGRIMQSGLWQYTRHPNYFGEAVFWWGIWVIAWVGGHFFTIIGPIVMTFLLVRVSGVPMLERRYRDDDEFQAYAARTSRFVPRKPTPAPPPPVKPDSGDETA